VGTAKDRKEFFLTIREQNVYYQTSKKKCAGGHEMMILKSIPL